VGFSRCLFPDDQVQILPYHRVVRDLKWAERRAAFLEALGGRWEVGAGWRWAAAAARRGGCYSLKGEWHTSEVESAGLEITRAGGATGCGVAAAEVLAPLLGIDDPRTSNRLGFVGGIRGARELERLVASRGYACAFALHPTSIGELLEVAESGGIMPPKSTWFEPKLRDGMFSHLLG
jgi:uncharacterized protein (DUF1015 family)